MSDSTTRVLFVCLGNICRSPLAEGIFLNLANQRGVGSKFRVDSAGTGGWHAGSPPDPRSVEVANRFGVHLPSRARQVSTTETDSWDLVLAMDSQNLADLVEMGFAPSRVRLIRSYDACATGVDVPDPYYGGPDGFIDVYHMLLAACEELVNELNADHTPDR